MINIRSFFKKCPLKIRISWEWNYKSKKEQLREALERIESLKALIRKMERGEKTVRSYTSQSEEAKPDEKRK